MNSFAVYVISSGRILSVGFSASREAALWQAGPGECVIFVPEVSDVRDYVRRVGDDVEVCARPSVHVPPRLVLLQGTDPVPITGPLPVGTVAVMKGGPALRGPEGDVLFQPGVTGVHRCEVTPPWPYLSAEIEIVVTGDQLP